MLSVLYYLLVFCHIILFLSLIWTQRADIQMKTHAAYSTQWECWHAHKQADTKLECEPCCLASSLIYMSVWSKPAAVPLSIPTFLSPSYWSSSPSCPPPLHLSLHASCCLSSWALLGPTLTVLLSDCRPHRHEVQCWEACSAPYTVCTLPVSLSPCCVFTWIWTCGLFSMFRMNWTRLKESIFLKQKGLSF